MKIKHLKLFAFIGILGLFSCGGGGNTGGGASGDKKGACSGKNEISTIKYDDADQEFKQDNVYANYNSIYKSYRVLYLNYPKAEDNDSGKKEAGQKRIVVGIFNPANDEFKPGKYTFAGDENKMNRVSVQVETADGMKSCNIAGVDDPGYVEITEVDNKHICGKFHLKGKGFELKGEFDTQHSKIVG